MTQEIPIMPMAKVIDPPIDQHRAAEGLPWLYPDYPMN